MWVVRAAFFCVGLQFSSVQLLSRVWLFATPWTAARQASLFITNSWSHTNPCPLSQRCHPTISSSVVPFSSCLKSLPASGSFPVSQLFSSGGQSIGVSASTSVLPMNTQDWSPLGWTGWILLPLKSWCFFFYVLYSSHGVLHLVSSSEKLSVSARGLLWRPSQSLVLFRSSGISRATAFGCHPLLFGAEGS